MNNSSSSPSLEVLSGYQDKIKLSESTVSVSNNIGEQVLRSIQDIAMNL